MDECENPFNSSSSSVNGSFSNSTCLGHAPTLTNSAIIRFSILMLMAIFSLIGNILTMKSIHKSKRTRSAHVYTLIYHLSISDIFVTFWCIMGEAIWNVTVEWKAGNVECKLFKFFQMFSLYLSTFIMVLIGVDRFIVVKYPLKPISKGLCFRFIAGCWALSALLSIPQMVVFHVSKGPFIEPFHQCVTFGFYTEAWQEKLYATFTLFSMFIVPFIILVSTYLLTVCTLQRNEEFPDASKQLIDAKRRNLIRRAKIKSLRISVAIVMTFLGCWIPYNTLMMIYIFGNLNEQGEDDHTGLVVLVNEKLKDGIFFFGMSNSLFNPLIYGIFHLRRPKRKELQRTSTLTTFVANKNYRREPTAGASTTAKLNAIETTVQFSNADEIAKILI